MDQQNPFKWRHFEAEIIVLCVRWYVRYSLSYRDLEEMMRDRGLHVDHTTIYRWAQHYVPELEQRCKSHLKATTDSWRVKPGLGFFSFETAWRTLQGYEVMHMMRKGQMRGVEKGDILGTDRLHCPPVWSGSLS